MIEIFVFAALSVFLFVRLWSLLGKHTGFEVPHEETQPINTNESSSDAITVHEAWPIIDDVRLSDKAFTNFPALKELKPNFNLKSFSDNALQAFRVIVASFAKGDKETLHQLLGANAYSSFEKSIQEREIAKETVEIEIHSLEFHSLEDIQIDQEAVYLTVCFLNEQTVVTKDEEGEILDNPSHISVRMKEHWTFAQSVGADEIAWELFSTKIETY